MSRDPLLARYFERIGYPGSAEATLPALWEIVWLHQLAIPFENLDIALFRQPISLEPAAIFAKLVAGGRGGFCFEQNGLLAAMLERMGFGVTMGYATWGSDAGEEIVPFDHLVLEITIPDHELRWLADAGFGRETPARPLPLAPGREELHEETGYVYRVLPSARPNRHWRIEQRLGEEPWRQLYDIDLTPRRMTDYEHRSRYNQTSPDSIFTQGTMCSRPFPGGRVTVARGTLILTRNGTREERALDGPGAELAALREWFGIDVRQEGNL
jgi:N-hydroxyarylamine O-acetyltransferase